MREGAVDELDEVDADEAEDEDTEAGRCDANWRPGPPGSRAGRSVSGGRLQVQLEPSGFLGFENARPQPLARRLGFDSHLSPSPPVGGRGRGPREAAGG